MSKYYSLYERIRGEIMRGKIKKDEKLPSKRTLAKELHVSVITVQLAYEQLLIEGYIRSEERRGYFAEEVNCYRPPETSGAVKGVVSGAKKYKIDLVSGNTPAELFPFATWARLIRLVLADCGEHLLERVPCDGDTELKTAVSEYLYRTRGIDADPKRIIIGAGAEHLYGVIVQLLGRDKLYAVENPQFKTIASAYAINGAGVAPVDVNASGMNLDMLRASGADFAHISPSHQFPTGAVMPAVKRSEMIEWAEKGEKFVIEDDYDSEFRLDGKPLQSMYSLCPERVIYINTFSKSLAPSMRMGYMVLPEALYNRYMELFGSSASIVPLFEQKALTKMLDGGYLERHISRLKNNYREVRELLLEGLRGKAEVIDTGGVHFVAKFYGIDSDAELKAGAEARGVRLKCMSDYLIAPRTTKGGVAVINYSGLTPEKLR